MSWIWLLPLAVWGGIGWRLRGGAFATTTGIDIGTQPTRVVFGGIWPALPLAIYTLDWRLALLAPAIALPLTTTGWGAFMDLGRDGATEGRRAGFTWALERLGLPRDSWWHDFVGLALCGTWLMLLPAALAGWLHGLSGALGVLAIGPLMAPSYALAYWLKLPLNKRLVDTETVWGEVIFGAVLEAGLALALLS